MDLRAVDDSRGYAAVGVRLAPEQAKMTMAPAAQVVLGGRLAFPGLSRLVYARIGASGLPPGALLAAG